MELGSGPMMTKHLSPCGPAARVVAWMDRHNFPTGSVHFVGASASDAPSQKKLAYLKTLIESSTIVPFAGMLVDTR